MIKVLHLTPHYGTGVGTVIRGFAIHQNKIKNNIFKHSYLSLEYINDHTKRQFIKNKITYHENIFFDKILLKKKIKECDITFIHWWNHPLLMELIANFKFPKARVVIWSHITGKVAPNCITNKIINFSDKFIFTTPVSKTLKVYKKLPNKDKIDDIWSTAGIERVKLYKKEKTTKFIIGYIGNLDFTKLHPEFIKFCEKVYEKNMLFIVIGRIVKNSLKEQIKNSFLKNKIILKGFVSEETKWKLLSTFNVFGYPLSRLHYGSCDQSIQEAMAAKIPVVALNNSMEIKMIKNNKTGFIVKDICEYKKVIRNIKNKKINLNNIKTNARNYAEKNFSLENMTNKWNDIFLELMKNKKKKRNFYEKKIPANKLYALSLDESCKSVKKFLLSKKKATKNLKNKVLSTCSHDNWLSLTKSSPFHYLKFFPKNKKLKELCELISKKY